MADLVSDLKWSKVISAFGNYKGGAVWLTDYYAAGITNKYIEGYWKSFDCSAFDKTVNTDPNTSPFEITLFEFENGVKMVIDFWWDTRNPVPNVSGLVRYKYGNITDDNVPYPNINPAVFNGPVTGETEFKTYGCKVCYFTNYTGAAVQQAGGVIQDVTPADRAGFMILMPWTYQSALQSWSHIHDGRMVMSSRDFPEEAATEPDGFFYPTGTNTDGVFNIGIAMYDDLDTLVNQIQQLNPGLPVDKDNLIKKGGLDDPVQEDDPSVPGGGGGGYDGTSDPIDFPNLPRGGALASGGCRAYRPTAQEIKSLMNTLWNTSIFDISTFQKLVDNPMDAIIGLHALPVTPVSSERALHVFVGNFNTNISMDTITNQYLTVDCGSIDLREFWGSALDYSPYTKIAVYLPFVGIKDLTIDDVMPKNIRIKYNIDVLTGDCIAFVKCGTAVLYKFAGNMKQDIPLTGQRSDVQLRGLVSTMSIIGSAAMGSAVGGGVGGGMILGATASGIGNVASSKIVTQRSGALGGNVGVLDEFTPYLIIHRPVQSLANNFKTFKGYPSNITRQLSSISGYTEVEYINLQNIPNATSAEMEEIKNLLNKGVLI